MAEAAARARDPAEERRAAAEALRPERALRRLVVLVDPAILKDAGADILLEALDVLGCEHRVEPQLRARSLSWSRVRPDPCPCDVPPQLWAAHEQELLLLLEPEEFLQGVARLTQVPPPALPQWRCAGEGHVLPECPGSSELFPGLCVLSRGQVAAAAAPRGREPEVSGPDCSVPWTCPGSPSRPHLAIIGLDAHLRYCPHPPAGLPGRGGWGRTGWVWEPRLVPLSRSHPRCVPGMGRSPGSPVVPHTKAAISWLQVEEALVLLQLWAGLDVLLVASWQELSEHVCAFTRALAQRPYKQLRESQALSFCTAGRWAASERAARHSRGLLGTWWWQIRQFNRVSPAVADAVVAAFPSPRLLQQAYVACSSERERLALLADLPVEVGQGGRPRRVGPDLSRRLYLFLTTCNPDLLLDLCS
ncbi:probable crossover junction endonuclease EME2 [Trichechus manatus latirostris]|uniref:Probable crossover junction endonuclease EME2 n=1 Tax=Trichechus manatus latirostris TaxID=127582 RepID=A0A2Y9QY31_TRIMA|nr:probable crossover junction endonuclease EME2 [Trichechus manatus latirostris]